MWNDECSDPPAHTIGQWLMRSAARSRSSSRSRAEAGRNTSTTTLVTDSCSTGCSSAASTTRATTGSSRGAWPRTATRSTSWSSSRSHVPRLRRPRAAGGGAGHGRREGPRPQDPRRGARRPALGRDEQPRRPATASAPRDRDSSGPTSSSRTVRPMCAAGSGSRTRGGSSTGRWPPAQIRIQRGRSQGPGASPFRARSAAGGLPVDVTARVTARVEADAEYRRSSLAKRSANGSAVPRM